MDVLFSIVVPIYNVEKELPRCIDSILSQTYHNIEILLVDDGSLDKCPQICDEYALKDERIKVFHKTNGGLSDARNAGIAKARGKYILFVDSDDYILSTFCETANDIIQRYPQVEIITGNAQLRMDDKIGTYRHTQYAKDKLVTGCSYIKHELAQKTMFTSVCLNIYQREFLFRHDLLFKVGILHEDEEFTPRAFLSAQYVLASGSEWYIYVLREGSISDKKGRKTKHALDMFTTCFELEKVYNKIQDVELQNLLKDQLAQKALSAYHMARLYKELNILFWIMIFLLGTQMRNLQSLR
jgi:glycosyltransferase involved in cell wall biosynthesis